jgi:hypothetical protein
LETHEERHTKIDIDEFKSGTTNITLFNFQSPFKISNSSDSNLTRAKLAIIVLDCTVLFGFEAVGNRESRA